MDSGSDDLWQLAWDLSLYCLAAFAFLLLLPLVVPTLIAYAVWQSMRLSRREALLTSGILVLVTSGTVYLGRSQYERWPSIIVHHHFHEIAAQFIVVLVVSIPAAILLALAVVVFQHSQLVANPATTTAEQERHLRLLGDRLRRQAGWRVQRARRRGDPVLGLRLWGDHVGGVSDKREAERRYPIGGLINVPTGAIALIGRSGMGKTETLLALIALRTRANKRRFEHSEAVPMRVFLACIHRNTPVI